MARQSVIIHVNVAQLSETMEKVLTRERVGQAITGWSSWPKSGIKVSAPASLARRMQLSGSQP